MTDIEFWTRHAAHSTYWAKQYLKHAREAPTPEMRADMLIAARHQIGQRRWARHNLMTRRVTH